MKVLACKFDFSFLSDISLIFRTGIFPHCEHCLTARASRVQWNPVNTDTKGTGQIVRIKRGLRKKVTDTCFLDAKTKANVFTATKRCLIVL